MDWVTTRRQILITCVMISSLLLPTGCAYFSGLKEAPKISVADIRLEDMRALEGVVRVQLRVLNPNNIGFELIALECELELEGKALARGVSKIDQVIPAYATELIEMPIYASVFGVIGSIAELLGKTNALSKDRAPITYALRGIAHLKVKGSTQNLPFRTSGELTNLLLSDKKNPPRRTP